MTPLETLTAALSRCDRELAEAKQQLRAGHPEVHGLCLALEDWSTERVMIEAEIANLQENPCP